ncbi:MAG: hypothetical protein AAGJ82_04770 [Bacteroidota bacterium]
MTTQQFFLQLLGVTTLTALVLWGMFQATAVAPYKIVGWISLGTFVLLSIGMYFGGRSAAQSSNKNNFTNAILGFTMGKMLLAIAILFVYLQLAKPADKFFILPFFAVYFLFTAFETYFMMRLGKA